MIDADNRLVRPGAAGSPGAVRIPWLWLCAAGLAAVFLLAPWPLAHKAHSMLHGLCAQRPSHSLTLGGQALPFDARMTGIYGGFATASVYLLARGRYRVFRHPTPVVATLLALFVAVLAVDGSNALLVDLGRTPLYEPDNRIRLATGLLTGTALAVALCYMTATTLWKRGDWSRRTVSGVGEGLVLVAIQAPFAAAALSGAGALHGPLSLLLVGAAAAAIGLIVLNAVVLGGGRDRSYEDAAGIQGVAAASLLGGVAVMAAIAAGRFWLETTYGLRTLP